MKYKIKLQNQDKETVTVEDNFGGPSQAKDVTEARYNANNEGTWKVVEVTEVE